MFGEVWSHPFSPNSEVALVVGALAQWYSRNSLIGVGRGFSGELYSEYYPDLARDPGRVQVKSQPFGLISMVGLALIGAVSEGTRVRGSDDKTRERHQSGPVQWLC